MAWKEARRAAGGTRTLALSFVLLSLPRGAQHLSLPRPRAPPDGEGVYRAAHRGNWWGSTIGEAKVRRGTAMTLVYPSIRRHGAEQNE